MRAQSASQFRRALTRRRQNLVLGARYAGNVRLNIMHEAFVFRLYATANSGELANIKLNRRLRRLTHNSRDNVNH